MDQLVNSLRDVLSPWGYVLLFAVVTLEASAFIGLFVPGESALLLAGVLVSQQKLDLVTVLVISILGAVIGDSIGYEIGRHFGERLRHTWLGRKIGEERWERAREALRRHGGKAVLIGRWVGVLRALVPAAAGDSRLPYRTFLKWNVAGALVWAPTVVALGYFAGDSYKMIEKFLGWGTLIVAAVVAAGWVVLRRVRERKQAGEGNSEPRDPAPAPARESRAGDAPEKTSRPGLGETARVRTPESRTP